MPSRLVASHCWSGSASGRGAEQIIAKRLTVETHLPAVEITGSATLLRRMIENVVENAVRHNQPDGSIELTLAPVNGHQARVHVDSSGPMISQLPSPVVTRPAAAQLGV